MSIAGIRDLDLTIFAQRHKKFIFLEIVFFIQYDYDQGFADL